MGGPPPCVYCGQPGCFCGTSMCAACKIKHEAINRNVSLTEEQKHEEFKKLHVHQH